MIRSLDRDELWLRSTIMDNPDEWKHLVREEMPKVDWSRVLSKFSKQNPKSLRKEW